MERKLGIYGNIVALCENPAEAIPTLESLARAETFSQAYAVLLPHVRIICMSYKDRCLFGSGVLDQIRDDLARLKDCVLRNSRLTEFMVDCAIERCVKDVNKEIADMEEKGRCDLE